MLGTDLQIDPQTESQHPLSHDRPAPILLIWQIYLVVSSCASDFGVLAVLPYCVYSVALIAYDAKLLPVHPRIVMEGCRARSSASRWYMGVPYTKQTADECAGERIS